MSYILDALNKSEQEKTETKTPGLNTVHQRVERTDSRTPERWQIIVALILTLNFAVLAVWYFTSSDSPDTQMTAQPPPRSSLPSITESTVAPSRAQSSERPQAPVVTRQTTTQETGRVALQAIPSQRSSGNDSRAVRLDTRTRLAAIRFSSHIFAADQALRMVVVDGQRMKEGDTLSGGIDWSRLQRMASSSSTRTRYPIDVLSQWDN